MGFLSNNYRDGFATCRFIGATLSNGASPFIAQSSTHRSGAFRNIFAGDADVDLKSSIPAGSRHPVAWQMPQKAGGLASHNNTSLNLSTTGVAVLGLPGSGSSTITFTADGTGGLVVSGSGSATITFSATGSILSVASGSGSATISLSASALIGALAGLQGQASVSLTPAAVISAIGYLSGTSTNETEFSADALARAVWDAVATNFNLPGSMGELLNDAGAAGNPWSASLASNNTSGTFGEFVQDLPAANDIATAILDLANGVETDRTVREALRLILSAVAGKLSGAGTSTVTIKDTSDTKTRITATVDSSGNRTAITYDDT